VRNRFQFPDVRIDRITRSYACARAEPPANFVYRWGCAGRNNIYLLGHAYSVFKPLHDAYAAGRLRVGMLARYTDSNGRTRDYRVTSWRVVKPTEAAWAIASQPVPSLTLQTCFGPDSEYRLLVRLVAA
jgi:sortase (surface protein transpeptidase)